jgi:uncharacterized protein
VRRKFVILGTLLLTAVPAGVAALTANALTDMMHLPRNVVADSPTAEVVTLRAHDGIGLRAAWVQSPVGTGSCVLSLHGARGWRGRSQRFLPWLLPAGYSVLAPDLRAHGESGGDTITFGLYEKDDTIAWARWMRGRGCRQIFAMGESMGASILILAQAQEPVFAKIVAECPFADLLDAAEQYAERMMRLPSVVGRPLSKLAVLAGSSWVQLREGLDLRASSPLQAIEKVRVPLLLIHGAKDEKTPASHSQRLLAANVRHGSLWLVPNAGHVRSYAVAPQEYQRRVLDFFAIAD